MVAPRGAASAGCGDVPQSIRNGTRPSATTKVGSVKRHSNSTPSARVRRPTPTSAEQQSFVSLPWLRHRPRPCSRPPSRRDAAPSTRRCRTTSVGRAALDPRLVRRSPGNFEDRSPREHSWCRAPGVDHPEPHRHQELSRFDRRPSQGRASHRPGGRASATSQALAHYPRRHAALILHDRRLQWIEQASAE